MFLQKIIFGKNNSNKRHPNQKKNMNNSQKNINSRTFFFGREPNYIRNQNQGNANEYKMLRQYKRLREVIFIYKNL